jgi:hypothetical protein
MVGVGAAFVGAGAAYQISVPFLAVSATSLFLTTRRERLSSAS